MAEKARDAFRTISEVANWLDVPAHVLRFWESKFPQIKPVKRAGGRRYYRPADMTLIGGIKKLLHDDGLTIRGVQKMLKEDGVKAISDLSPALDMPSEEEGAARREARRARRQARQESRKSGADTPAAASSTSDAIETAGADDRAEAPFTHVEDEPTGGDNVVSITGSTPEAITSEDDNAAVTDPTDNSPEDSEHIEEHAVTEAGSTQEPTVEEPATNEPEQHASVDQADPDFSETPETPEVFADEDQMADVPTAHVEDHNNEPEPASDIEEPVSAAPISTIPEPQESVEVPVEDEAEPDRDIETVQAEPVQHIEVAPDPDPADITLTNAQERLAATIKRLRRGDMGQGDDTAGAQAALAKLTELRARMASNHG